MTLKKCYKSNEFFIKDFQNNISLNARQFESCLVDKRFQDSGILIHSRIIPKNFELMTR